MRKFTGNRTEKSDDGKRKTNVKPKYYDLQKMKDGFLLEQNCRGNSEETIKYYDWNVSRYIRYLEECELDIDTSSINKEEIKRYIVYLKSSKKLVTVENISSDEKLASKSIQTYIRAIKAWVSWMEGEGYLDTIISDDIKLPRAAAPIIEILTEDEIKNIIKYLESKKLNHLRDLAIVMVLIECGVRLNEVTHLKLSNVNLSQHTLKVLGKGNKERFISFGVNLQKVIFKYINQERSVPINPKIESLFLKEDGAPICQTTIKQLFRRLRVKTGISKIYPHLCRHTYCTMYLARGGDLFSLKQSTGHESFGTLNLYVHLASSFVNIKDKSLSLIDSMKIKV